MKTKMKNIYLLLTFFVAITIGGTSCTVHYQDPPPPPPPVVYYGPDGLPGFAFLSVDWTGDKPDFISTNNGAIPTYFQYGAFYQSHPGFFNLYYEGAFYDGPDFIEYFWDVDFEVWINAGYPGQPGNIPGANGLDSYLTMVCNPFGPFEERMNKTMPESMEGFEILSKTDDEIVIKKENEFAGIKITYTKVVASKKASILKDEIKTEKP